MPLSIPDCGKRSTSSSSFLESPAAQQAKDPLPRWMAETGFAAGYLLKRFDLIPDQVAESGLADDVLILQRVVRRNQSELIAG